MATRYVRQGATGANNGTNWTDAYTTLIGATLSRGDLCYVADGSYAGRTFSIPNSGTTPIEIRKATVADHGTSVGWLDTYGDGSATFTSQLAFTSSYWLLDGSFGGGPLSWAGPCGFILSGEIAEMVLLDDGATNVTVRHVEFSGTGSYNGTQAALRANSCIDCVLEYYYMHDIGFIPFFSGAANLVVQYGYVKNWFDGANHSELSSTWAIGSGNIGAHTFRWNLFTDVRSTGGIMWDNVTSHAARLDVYGNVFYNDASNGSGGMNNNANGIVGGWTGSGGEDFFNCHVFNNTYINIDGSGDCLGTLPIRAGSNEARNNLFYTVASIGGSSGVWETVSHNHFVATSSVGTNTSTGTGNPFQNITAKDFRLTANTTPGIDLGAPYNVDMLGNTRVTWTRGALEFGVDGGGEIGGMGVVGCGRMLILV